jgi:L-asparaginase II
MSDPTATRRARDADQHHAGRSAGDPVLVEVTRGAMVESRHRGAAVVVDVDGQRVGGWGDVARPIYARSAVKPIQALALVESGAADAYHVSDAELALACASHGGEPAHVDTVSAWLARLGCSDADLECGAHLPLHAPAAEALLRAQGAARPVHNNCSGKHAGFLTVARHLGHPIEGYVRLEHPVQQQWLGIFEQLTGLDLGAAPRGIDGCGIPVIAAPLQHLAYAMARFGRPVDLPDHRATAATRVRTAMAAHPHMVAGTDRFCTAVLTTLGQAICLKTGAEGVFMGALPERGLGFALKIADGAGRAAQVATLRLIDHLGALDDAHRRRLATFVAAPVRDRAGHPVGEVRAAADCPF